MNVSPGCYATSRWRQCIRQCALAALVMLLHVPSGEAAVRQVVLLQSFERGNLVLDQFSAVLRKELGERSAEPLTFVEFVVTPSGFSDPPEQAVIEFLRAAFIGRPAPDLVITLGGPAAAFAREHRQQLFSDTAILYASVDQRFLGSGFTDRETAVAGVNDPVASVAEILQVFPATEKVFVVVGAGPLGRFWRSTFANEFSQFKDRLQFLWPDGMSYAAILQRASTLPPRSAIFYSFFDSDVDGARYSTERILADLRARANAPVFVSQGAEIGHGPVGGFVIHNDDFSRTTAAVALQILSGTRPSSINTPIQKPGPAMFDWRELQRWAVSENRLPTGSIVLFREPGVWERDKWLIIGSVAALGAQSLLLTGLLVSRVRRRRTEQSLRESEGRFRVLANSASVMIRMSDVDALATDFNTPWLDFTGRRLEAVQGTGWLEGVHPDDVSTVVDTRRRAFERREAFRMEYRLQRADGEYRWLLDNGQPRFTPDGVFVGFIGSAIDITDLKAARATLSNLNLRLMEAQEHERLRLARELHDDVCQRLSLLGLDLARLGEHLSGNEPARQQARDLYESVGDLTAYVNGISHTLHSSKLDILGLAAAAATFCTEVSSRSDVTVEFVHDQVPARLPDDVAINMFRVLQEALSNAVKHSGASRCHVSLRGMDDQLQLEVRDAGKGFDAKAALASSGLGLVSMQERLKLVNGRVAIETKAGAGTTVRVTVPFGPKILKSSDAVGHVYDPR